MDKIPGYPHWRTDDLETQFNFITNKMSRLSGIIAKLRHYVGIKILRDIYFTLITRAWKGTSLKMRIFFFLSSKSASTDWLRNNTCDVASRRKLAPGRRGRVVRALDSRPETPELGSHSQQFVVQAHAL